MVKIRLTKNKKNKNSSYKIVVTDSRNSINGNFIEKLGFINNNFKIKNKYFLNINRIEYWIKNGAKLSDKVKFLYKNYTKLN